MSLLFALTNVLLLLALWKILRGGGRSFYFNPYLAAADGLADKALDYAGQVLPGAGRRAVALAVFVFLLVFRNLLFPWLASSPVADFGGGAAFPPLRPGVPRLVSAMAAGTSRFVQFLLSAWGALMIARLVGGRRSRGTRVLDACEEVTYLFSRLETRAMPAALVLFHALFAFVLASCLGRLFGDASPFGARVASAGPARMALVSLWLGAMGAVSCSILFYQKLLMALIFASLFAVVLRKGSLAVFCQEAIGLLLGRFAERPLLAGAFDFTPILFYIGLSFAYYLLVQALSLLRPFLFMAHP